MSLRRQRFLQVRTLIDFSLDLPKMRGCLCAGAGVATIGLVGSSTGASLVTGSSSAVVSVMAGTCTVAFFPVGRS